MTRPPPEGHVGVPPLAGMVFKGTVFTFLLRMVVRLLGLISLSVTARLLTPEDFGVAGTASLVLGLFLIMREVGMGDALIRQKDPDIYFIRTTWTLRVITSAIVTIILLAVAAPASVLLNEPRVEEVIMILAFIPLIQSFASPASSFFIKNFHFGRELLLKSIHKLSVVSLTIYFAVTLQNYWALVYGNLFGAIVLVVLSQLFFPMKPIPSLRSGKYLSKFAFWMFWRSIAIYAVGRGDEFVVRRLTDTAQFGLYHAGRDLTRIFILELMQATTIAFFSVISRLRDEGPRFTNAIETMFSVAAIIATPAAIGLTLVAGEVVQILLGDQWGGAASIIAGVSIGVGAQAISTLCLHVFTALDRQDLGAMMWLVRAALLIVACTVSGFTLGVDSVPLAFSTTSVLLALCEIGFTYRMIGLPVRRLWGWWYRPIAAAVVMYFVVAALPLSGVSVVMAALAKAFIGSLTYASVLIILWLLAKRPRGGEKALMDRLSSLRSLAG